MHRPQILTTIALLSALALPAAAPAAPVKAPQDGRAEPLRVERGAPVARAAQTTGDPLYEEQWGVGPSDGAMGVPGAWRTTVGGDVTVAVLDSGADLGHPELAPNLWRNPDEIAGNGVDDDGNGFVDDVHGADVIGHDGDPTDGNGHGTHVAGIVAARGDNGIGVAGVAWHARVMVVRVLDDGAAGDTSTVAQGLDYAVREGARIVNLSLAGPGASAELQAAVGRARDAGVLVVASAGNDHADLGVTPSYPASYPEENVIGVAATRPGGVLSAISSFGVGADVAAPGEDVLSTSRGGGYEWRTGTSMAAPHVAGALVLLAAARPDLSWQQLRATLLGTARRGLPVEAGSVDAAAAIQSIAPSAATPAPSPAPAAKRKSTARKASKSRTCKTIRRKGRKVRQCTTARASRKVCRTKRTKAGATKRVCFTRRATAARKSRRA